MTTGVPGLEAIPITESILNWLWLADLREWGSVLEIAGGPVDLSAPLAAHFRRAERIDISTWLAGERQPPALGEVAHDCIVAHGILDPGPGRPGPWTLPLALAFFRACGEALRPGGCLAVSLTNPFRIGRRAPGAHPVSPRLAYRMGDRLTDAGFASVRKLHLEPSLTRVRAVTPASPALLRNRLDQRPGTPIRRRARHLLLRAGTGDLLFPATLFLAYR